MATEKGLSTTEASAAFFPALAAFSGFVVFAVVAFAEADFTPGAFADWPELVGFGLVGAFAKLRAPVAVALFVSFELLACAGKDFPADGPAAAAVAVLLAGCLDLSFEVVPITGLGFTAGV